MEASLERAVAVLRPRVRRERKGADLATLVGLKRPHPADETITIIARHSDVADEDIGAQSANRFERLIGGRHNGHVCARPAKNRREKLPGISLIVDDQDPPSTEAD